MKTCIAILGFGLAFSSWCASASAGDFGHEGDTSLAADRLTGFYLVNTGTKALEVGLGAAPLFAPEPYTTTRFAVDHFIAPSVSLGGSLAFWLKNGDEIDGRRNHASGYLVAPRVGYVLPLSESLGFWPRGGISFWDVEYDSEFGLTAEAVFYAAIGDHFGLTFGPTADLGIVGEGRKGVSLGLLSVGLFGWM